jgi:hypothetical protein
MIDFGAFLDSYYAYDFNRPEVERAYTTQPIKHDKPAINLAHIEMKIQSERMRSRIALQAGDSVERNAVLEHGTSKYIQESYLGVKLGEKTWVDAGIFLGNIGAESWISKDNWTYTRSLLSDYTPYYSAGVRIDHQINQKQSIQLQVLNGWQNISENNGSKAIGIQYKHQINEDLTFIYNNFLGDEGVVSTKLRFRTYHNFIMQWLASEKWQYNYSFDIGEQAQQNNHGIDPWFGTSLIIRRILNTDQSLSLRAEYYNDRHQANVLTETDHGFQVAGASINFDQKIMLNAAWRTELRSLYSKDKIYPQAANSKNRLDGFILTSLSVWF